MKCQLAVTLLLHAIAVALSLASVGAGHASAPTADTFIQVSAGGYHTCWVRSDSTLVCWGANSSGQATPPAGTFAQVSAGLAHTCAVGTDSTLACWGLNNFGQATPPSGTFTQVSAETRYSCGVETDGTLTCWGFNEFGQARPPAGTFTEVSTGDAHACGLRSDGTIACWGFEGQAIPPVGIFTQVSTGLYHTCAVRSDSTLVCWGSDSFGQATPPAGTFAQVSAGGRDSCGIRSDGTLACWGEAFYYAAPSLPAGAFTQVSVGNGHTCGLRDDGTHVCWGNNSNGQASGPGLLTGLNSAEVWIGLRNSDDVGLRVDLLAEVFLMVGTVETRVGQGQLDNQPSGSSGFTNAINNIMTVELTEGWVPAPPAARLGFKLSVRRTCSGSGHNSGTVRLWYNGPIYIVGSSLRRDASSLFDAAFGSPFTYFFLRGNFSLRTTQGTSRLFVDKFVNSSAPCPGRPFTPFGIWSLTLP